MVTRVARTRLNGICTFTRYASKLNRAGSVRASPPANRRGWDGAIVRACVLKTVYKDENSAMDNLDKNKKVVYKTKKLLEISIHSKCSGYYY